MNKEGHIGVVSNTNVTINKNTSTDVAQKRNETIPNSMGGSMQSKMSSQVMKVVPPPVNAYNYEQEINLSKLHPSILSREIAKKFQ